VTKGNEVLEEVLFDRLPNKNQPNEIWKVSEKKEKSTTATEGCVYHLGSRGGPRSSSKAVNTRPGGQIGLTPWARGENNA
jgi:hypothetical protein